MKMLIVLFLLIPPCLFCQINKDSSQSTMQRELDNVARLGETGKSCPDQIRNISFVAASGEKMLRFEVILDTTLKAVWDAFTTEKGITGWEAAKAKLDLRVGGTLLTLYDKNANFGDKGTIVTNIPAYIPMELFIFKVNLNEAFPEKCRNEDQNLQEIVQFRKISENKTKIISSMIGWGTGEDWDKVYKFFESGNKWTYEQLAKMFTPKK
jgi:Activator of Hsp90 ATPase homolog 1-like protein